MRSRGAALLLLLLSAVLLTLLPPPLPAAPEEPPGNLWVQVETEHFRLIYMERDEAAAREVLAVADRVWRDTTRYMTYRPRERVPVVLYGNTAQANGFFTPYPPHIALFVSSPAGPWLGARTESWTETVFIHELIHYLHLTQPIGFFGSPSRVFGPLLAATGTLFMPGWTVEGVAVYAESHLAPGGRGDNPFFEMQAVAPILENRMYSYDQAGFSSPFAPRGRIYTAGYLMVDFLHREYGEQAFSDLNRSFQRAPFLGMRRAVRSTFGLSAPDLYGAMVADLEARYAERRAIPARESISPGGPGNWNLPVPTDRGMIGWALDYDRGPGLYLHEPGEEHGAGWRLLAPVAVAEEWSWTVDRSGTRAVVSHGTLPGSAGPAPATGESFADLFLLELPPDGNTARPRDRHRPVPTRRITTGRRLFHPGLSPAGDRLFALERRGSYSRLVAVDLETGAVEPLWEPPYSTLAGLTVSPCGELLAMTVNHRGRQDVVVTDAATGRERARLLADSTGAYHFPRFVEGPERELWFGSEVEGQLALYRSALTGEDEELYLTDPQKVLRDRVAAWAGFPLPPREEEGDRRTVVYGSYTADGYAVKRATLRLEARDLGDQDPETQNLDDKEGPPVAPPAPGGAAPGGTAPAIPLNPRPYRDIPRPVLWLPQAFYRTGGGGEDQFDLGILAQAASNLGRHAVELSVLYNPAAHQPSGRMLYTWTPGAIRWNVLLEQEYRTSGNPPVTETTSSAGIFASRSLWTDRRPGSLRALTGGAGVDYRSSVVTPGSASFSTSLTGDERTVSQEIEYTVLLRFVRAGTGAPRDFFGPPAREISTRLDLGPHVESTTGAVLRMYPFRRLSGSPGALQVVPAAHLTTNDAGKAPDRLPYRSGGFPTTREAEIAALGRLELRMPLGLYDAAWRGLATTGSGVGVYLEQGHAEIDYAVAGTELTMDLFFNMIPLRVTAGAAARIPHPDSDVDRDWMMYFRLGGPVADVLGLDTP